MAADLTNQCAWQRWTCGSVVTTSLRHQVHAHASQDAAYARLTPRPIVLVADGRGSSDHSEIGAGAAPDCVAATVDQCEALLALCLDTDNFPPEVRVARWEQFADTLRQALVRRQEDLARTHALDADELEFTLAVAVVGTKYVGIIQVGDSCIVLERRLEVELALPPDRGEFANETNFISPREGSASKMASRMVSMRDVTGLVAFTDGVSQLWINSRTLAVAPGVGRILRNLGNQLWDQQRLGSFLNLPVWHEQDDDDKGVAYLAKRTLRPARKSPKH
jgi:hypothetical protein